MSVAAFCGTFDPVTLGHIDVIERSASMFDQVVVFIAPNSSKHEMFSKEQRLQWLQDAIKHLSNVECHIQSGLAVEACRKVGATVMIRGIRNAKDFEYEQNMDYMNRHIDDSIETICLITRPEYMYCSSSNIRELMKYNLDFSKFVPKNVYEDLKEVINIENV